MCRCEAVYFRRSSLPPVLEIASPHEQRLTPVPAVLAQATTHKLDFLIFATEPLKSSLQEIAPPQASAIREDPASTGLEQLAPLEA
jgi:hypothetical protein